MCQLMLKRYSGFDCRYIFQFMNMNMAIVLVHVDINSQN